MPAKRAGNGCKSGAGMEGWPLPSHRPEKGTASKAGRGHPVIPIEVGVATRQLKWYRERKCVLFVFKDEKGRTLFF